MTEPPIVIWRRAQREDMYLLFDWVNDPVVRGNSFKPEPISPSTHFAWFSTAIADPDCLLLILLEAAGGTPIGQARFNRFFGVEADISIALASEWRGRGIGALAIAVSTAEASVKLKLQKIHAVVKIENEASRRAFLRAGYEEVGPTTQHGQQAVHFVRVC